MKKATAKIVIDGNVETIEGGLKSWDETSLVFVLPTGGEATYPKDDVEDLQISEELFELKQPEVKTEAPKTEKSEKTSSGSKELKAGSKLAQVVELCKANPGKSRKEMIALIVEKLGMTAAGASTYHQNAKAYL